MKAIVSIYAGAGGTDAQDWALMLEQMYIRWANSHNKKVTLIEKSYGSEAGIKSAVLEIDSAYEQLKNESGVHRLVRKSPFKKGDQRHTSFALVEVLPQMPQVKININQSDLRVDTYRATGPGGQHVNKTDSAVRITHKPTNITVACQSQRSQAQNKHKAMQILKSRIYAQKILKKQQEIEKMKTGQSPQWGNRRRSYVLYPYKMIKDELTGKKYSQVDDILDGELDKLLKQS